MSADGLMFRTRCKIGGSMKKVCIFCEKWASGGIESFLTNVLSNIEQNSLHIEIVAACVEESVFTNRLDTLHIAVHELSGNRNHIWKNRKLFLRLLNERHYDVVHINAFHAASLYYLKLAWRAGIPVRIAHSHNTALKDGCLSGIKGTIHAISKYYYTKYATHLWACSEQAAKFMFQLGNRKYEFIPNGIDTGRFRYSEPARVGKRTELHIDDGLVVGNVGRLSVQKNQKFLLEIFAEWIKKYPNSWLLLVGEGEMFDRLHEIAHNLQISDKVIFCGNVQDVESLLCAMDIFVFPSVFEGLGIAAVEAQASGLPVICSDRVPSEAFILPTVRKVALDAEAPKWVMSMEDTVNWKCDREKCSEQIRERGFDIKDVASHIENTYKYSV